MALGAITLIACGDSDDPHAAATTSFVTSSTTALPEAPENCDTEVQEQIDPSSFVHALPGSEPTYLTDPPTSGAHAPAPPLSGMRVEALARPVQVGHLESGGVLIQHRDVPAEQLETLRTLATGQVAVAPNPELSDPVVATAWLYKLTCQAVDEAALRSFIDAHADQGPGH